MDQPLSSSAADAPAGPCLLSLPSETLRAIFSYAKPSDLVSLCRVSNGIRDVAVTLLYQSLSHEFSDPKEGNLVFDRLAGMLETLTMSDFNYALFIKEVNLSATHRVNGTVNHEFGYGHTCGKFLNTLLLAALKKTTTLESFRWDVRVEISPSMFEALGKTSSLHHLHLRMHPGKSLSSSNVVAPATPSPASTTHHHHHHHHHQHAPPTAGLQHGNSTGLASATNLARSQDVHNFANARPTFSRFRHLETLAALEMDTLDYVPEITECVAQCAVTLKTLKLSLSESLALKARKKQQQTTNVSDSDTTMEGEGFYDIPGFGPPTVAGPSTGASGDPDARREFMEQERVLSRIFGLSKESQPDCSPDPVHRLITEAIAFANRKSRASAKMTETMADRVFVKEIRSAAQQTHQMRASGNSNDRKAWKAIQALYKAATIYLERCDAEQGEPFEEDGSPSTTTAYPPNLDPEATDNFNALVGPNLAGPSTNPHHIGFGPPASSGEDNLDAPLLQGVHSERDAADEQQKAHIREVVDMEHPDDDGEEGEDQQFVDSADASQANVHDSAPVAEAANNDVDTSHQGTDHGGMDDKGKEPVRSSSTGEHKDKCSKTDCSNERKILDYIRSHHGLPLENLSICLIPLKHSVICRAVNVWALKHISLLNVGPQRNFWATLGKLNVTTPLQISSIHTDNVTATFLDLVHDLKHVKELFMFERSSRTTVKSLAPKTTVSIRDIRLKVLKRHVGRLERLIIRNDEDLSWSLDNDAIECIVRNGNNLQELVVALGSSSFHRFIQNVWHLGSLVALHVLFLSSENCSAVLREARSALVDAIVLRRPQSIYYVAISNAPKEPQSTTTTVLRLDWDIQKLSNREMRQLSGLSYPGYPELPYLAGMTQNDGEIQDARSDASFLDDDENGPPFNEGFIIEEVHMEDVKGVKVWEKDIWHIRL